jgi:hypothetical protein
MKFKNKAGIFYLPLVALLGLMAISSPADPVPACDAPPSGMVDWWPAEGNAADIIGNGIGTVYPGTGYTNGVVGQAFSFDGITGCVMNTNTPALTNIQNNFSFEFWAYPQKGFNLLPEGETDASGTNAANGTSEQSYAIFPDWGGDAGPAGIGISVGTNGISVLGHAANYLPSLLSYPVAITGWVHVAVVFTNEQPTLYLNGVNVRTGVVSSRTYVYPSKNLGNSYMPFFNFQSYGPYQGFLDEVSIYNRALTATEIQAIYAAGAAGKCFTGTPPTITVPPAALTTNLNATALFGLTVTGTQPLYYQWSADGTNITGATNATLTLSEVQPADAGDYTVVVENLYGSVTNSNAALTVLQPPVIIVQPVGESVLLSNSVSFNVVATGSGLHYQWELNGSKISNATATNFTLASALVKNAGNYQVVVTNSSGSVTSSNVVLTVIHPAVATPVVDFGFLVSASISNGGAGYTNVPSVTIVGGGGTGAQAVAVVSNGVVIAINFLNAGNGDYTNQPTIFIEPPVIPQPMLGLGPVTIISFSGLTNGGQYQFQKLAAWYWTNQAPLLSIPTNGTITTYTQILAGTLNGTNYRLAITPLPVQAFATAVTKFGFFVDATSLKGGSGYATAPAVKIVGGGGAGATAVAEVSTNEVVTGIMVVDAGSGYTNLPTIQIAPPPASVLTAVATNGLGLSVSNAVSYENYQIQFAPAIDAAWQNWTGGAFTPTNATSVQYIFDSALTDFYRLVYVP